VDNLLAAQLVRGPEQLPAQGPQPGGRGHAGGLRGGGALRDGAGGHGRLLVRRQRFADGGSLPVHQQRETGALHGRARHGGAHTSLQHGRLPGDQDPAQSHRRPGRELPGEEVLRLRAEPGQVRRSHGGQ